MDFKKFLKKQDEYLKSFWEYAHKEVPHVKFKVISLEFTHPGGEVDAGINAVLGASDGHIYEMYYWMPHPDNFFESDHSFCVEVTYGYEY